VDVPTTDILCVGDVATDEAIELIPDDSTITYEDEDGPWLAMRFGAKLPFAGSRTVDAVGNAANAAVACRRLGLRVALVSDVGDDHVGRRITEHLAGEDVDTATVRVHPGRPSNRHYLLRYREERTILTRHEEYAYRWPAPTGGREPRWVYLSSLAEHAAAYQHELEDWLAEHPWVHFAFQPGTLQLRAGVAGLERLYRRAEVLVLNREEATALTGGDHADVVGLLGRLHALGPSRVVITDGPAGAYASGDGLRLWMPAYPDPGPPVERTGAGDAFAATLVAALAHGEDFPTALRWAPVNSMSVVQQVGGQAGLLGPGELASRLERAPADYRPSPWPAPVHRVPAGATTGIH
jgi:sugar/nucleoside kinase (ribokinase family)